MSAPVRRRVRSASLRRSVSAKRACNWDDGGRRSSCASRSRRWKSFARSVARIRLPAHTSPRRRQACSTERACFSSAAYRVPHGDTQGSGSRTRYCHHAGPGDACTWPAFAMLPGDPRAPATLPRNCPTRWTYASELRLWLCGRRRGHRSRSDVAGFRAAMQTAQRYLAGMTF